MTDHETFLLHPESKSFLKGETDRLPGAPIAVGCVWIPIVIGLIGVAAVGTGNRLSRQAMAFKQHQENAQGTIVDLRVSTSVSGPDPDTFVVSSEDDYLAKYRFEAPANGVMRSFEREASISSGDFHQLTRGGHVNVAYDKTDPADSRLEIERDSLAIPFLIVGGWLSLGLGMLALVGALVARRKNRLLLQYGQRLQGAVIKCEPVDQEDGSFMIQLEYGFRHRLGKPSKHGRQLPEQIFQRTRFQKRAHPSWSCTKVTLIIRSFRIHGLAFSAERCLGMQGPSSTKPSCRFKSDVL